MILPSEHLSIIHGPDIREICKPLFDQTGINFFIYCRFYDDGTLISFPSNTEWHLHFMKMEYFSNKLRMKEGMHLWTLNEEYSQATIDARTHFNIDNKFEIVERGKDYWDVYGYASKTGETRIIDYFINNIDYLKRYGMYFKNKAERLITMAKKMENRLNIGHQILGQTTNENIKFSDDFMKNKIKHYHINGKDSGEVYLTSREMQIVLSVLQQRSATDIGRELNLSSKTVEYYLAEAKDKLGCSSKIELFDKALETGLLQLIHSKEKK